MKKSYLVYALAVLFAVFSFSATTLADEDITETGDVSGVQGASGQQSSSSKQEVKDSVKQAQDLKQEKGMYAGGEEQEVSDNSGNKVEVIEKVEEDITEIADPSGVVGGNKESQTASDDQADQAKENTNTDFSGVQEEDTQETPEE